MLRTLPALGLLACLAAAGQGAALCESHMGCMPPGPDHADEYVAAARGFVEDVAEDTGHKLDVARHALAHIGGSTGLTWCQALECWPPYVVEKEAREAADAGSEFAVHAVEEGQDRAGEGLDEATRLLDHFLGPCTCDPPPSLLRLPAL